jgi:hypothetical protein
LHEEALLGPTNNSKRGEIVPSFKKTSQDNSRVYSTGYPPRYSSSPGEEKRSIETSKGKTREDRLSALKSFRKSKWLCF